MEYFIAGFVLVLIVLTYYSVKISIRDSKEFREKEFKKIRERVDYLENSNERILMQNKKIREDSEKYYATLARNVPRTSSSNPVKKRERAPVSSTPSASPAPTTVHNDSTSLIMPIVLGAAVSVITSPAEASPVRESYRSTNMHEERSSSYRNTDMDSSSYSSSSDSSSSSSSD